MILTYDDLGITLTEVYDAMQYGADGPDEASRQEISNILDEIREILRARFTFIIRDDISIFNLGKIITSQLKGAEKYALFICTAGREFMEYQERVKAEGDIFKMFAVDSIGSVLAEKCADEMETFLNRYINSDKVNAPSMLLHTTNRFSPGYCGWHVSQQQLLFPLFEGETCGVELTESSLMVPIKSVSGVIGIGKNVRRHDYTCGLCDYSDCYKRKRKL